MIEKTEPTYQVMIYIAGDLATARQSLRCQCHEKGLCVTLTATDYVYTAGMEAGVEVGLRNYPRFPSSRESLVQRAETVAMRLMDDLNQDSVLIVAPETTQWFSRRREDLQTQETTNGQQEVRS